MENRTYSAAFRILHWAIAFCMLFMLLTIFLRLNWMNKVNVSEIIQNYLSTTDQSLTEEQSIKLAKLIRKPMWEWHIYTGYVLVGLYVIRMILPFFGEMKFNNPLQKELSLKEKFQYWTYLIFYLCSGLSLITGLIIEFGPNEWKHQTEEIHMLSIYYLLAFIIIHFGGVLLAELSTHKGIISKVISGDSK